MAQIQRVPMAVLTVFIFGRRVLHRLIVDFRRKINSLGWALIQCVAMPKENMARCGKILRAHGYDIARSPLLTVTAQNHRRVPEEKELFKRVYSQFSQVVAADFSRCYLLFTQARRVVRQKVQGDFTELGVYRGTTAKLLLQCCDGRTLHLFDTFEGQPDNAIEEIDGKAYREYVLKSRLSNTSLEEVKVLLGNAPNVLYYKGYFPCTAEKVEDATFALVHIDADQYQSTKEGCEFFFPRISPGGVLICHDYGIYEGVKKAIDEYFAKRSEVVIEFPDATGSVCIIKN